MALVHSRVLNRRAEPKGSDLDERGMQCTGVRTAQDGPKLNGNKGSEPQQIGDFKIQIAGDE